MSRRRRGPAIAIALAVAVLGAGLLAACGDDDEPSAGTTAATASGGVDPQQALAALATTVLSTGPNGEPAVAPSEVELTPAELEEIRGLNATAAIVMHLSSDWANAQIAGLTAQFEEMGVEVIATTNAGFDAAKQVADIETVLARQPDIIVSLPVDPVATADAYRKAIDQGVELVFMDNIPEGFTPGEDYVSVVSADNSGNGVASAHLMAQALGGSGKVGTVFHDADFFVTNQRYDAFKQTLAESYPDIEIVEEQGFGGPDFAGDGERLASAMLTRTPDLDGIWVNWDEPAEGVIAAARTAARDDLVVTTIDLGLNVAIDIAGDGVVFGLGAQRPFDQGVTEATLAGYALIDKTAPEYVALTALPVTKENVGEAWETVYHVPPPDELGG